MTWSQAAKLLVQYFWHTPLYLVQNLWLGVSGAVYSDTPQVETSQVSNRSHHFNVIVTQHTEGSKTFKNAGVRRSCHPYCFVADTWKSLAWHVVM
jgi:hypothetical protein